MISGGFNICQPSWTCWKIGTSVMEDERDHHPSSMVEKNEATSQMAVIYYREMCSCTSLTPSILNHIPHSFYSASWMLYVGATLTEQLLPWNNDSFHHATSGENKHIKRGMSLLAVPATNPQSEFIEDCSTGDSGSLAVPLPKYSSNISHLVFNM